MVWADSSLANVYDDDQSTVPLATQVGVVVGVADKSILETGEGPVNFVAHKTHKLKRKVRSSFAGETGAVVEGLEFGDLIRAHLVEPYGDKPLDKRKWRDELARIPMVVMTDSRSLYDYVKRGSKAPAKQEAAS